MAEKTKNDETETGEAGPEPIDMLISLLKAEMSLRKVPPVAVDVVAGIVAASLTGIVELVGTAIEANRAKALESYAIAAREWTDLPFAKDMAEECIESARVFAFGEKQGSEESAEPGAESA